MKLYLPPSLCESTANWQPVITTHLPCSASALRSSLSSEQNRGIFLNWPLGNSIYSRAVAAEFAPQSVLAKLAWKLQIKSQSSEFYYSLGTNDAFEQSPRGPNRKVRDRVSAQVSRIQDGPPPSPALLWVPLKPGQTRPTDTDTFTEHFLVQMLSEDVKKETLFNSTPLSARFHLD